VRVLTAAARWPAVHEWVAAAVAEAEIAEAAALEAELAEASALALKTSFFSNKKSEIC